MAALNEKWNRLVSPVVILIHTHVTITRYVYTTVHYNTDGNLNYPYFFVLMKLLLQEKVNDI